MADVFISYHEDSAGELAGRIAAALEAGGVSCWCARREIGAGGDFAEAIPREIGQCRIFLLLISRGAVESPYVRNEIGLAFKRTGSRGGVVILPFYVEECPLPDWLGYYLVHTQRKDLPPMDVLVRHVAAALGRKPAVAQPPKPVIETPPPIVQPQIWTPKHTTISAGTHHAVALRRNGTVVVAGDNFRDECNVSGWHDIVEVSAGVYHTVGLRRDGTVVASGENTDGKCEVMDWRDMIAVSAGLSHTVGLQGDGTVIATGDNSVGGCNVMDWRDMIAVSAGKNYTLGLRRDGTVASTNSQISEVVYKWRNIVAISAGETDAVALREDGTVSSEFHERIVHLYKGLVFEESFGLYNLYNMKDLLCWRDISSVSAGAGHYVGLRRDGTVVAVLSSGHHERLWDVYDWKNIVAISAGTFFTMGLSIDGSVIAVGDRTANAINAAHWTDIRLPD